MSIEEQIAALEARIQQCIILASGCTERAEAAASRAEEAAARAELARLESTQAEVVAMQAAESAQVAEIVAVEAAEIAVIEEEAIEEGLEDGREILPEQGRSGTERETAESDDLLDGERQAEESPQPAVQPIVIEIKEHNTKQPQFFKPNNTRFRRGRTA